MLMTNFIRNDKQKYLEALRIYKEQTGDQSLYVDNNAYLRNGRKDEGMCALRCTEMKDLSEFWKIYEYVKSA
jgi:hypothetical protein